MSFLSNFFNKLKKSNFSKKVQEQESTTIPKAPICHHSNSQAIIHNQNIYKNPTYANIRSNISVHQLSLLVQYHDLAYVASCANDSIVMAAPVKQPHTGKLADEYNRIFNENLAFVEENFKKNIKSSRKMDSHLYTRAQLFENIRNIYPDFGQNMKEKVSPENYELYHSNLVKFKKSLNCEVVAEPFKLLSESLAKAQSEISEIVETFDFSSACKIEDKFILSELDIFFAKLTSATQEQQANAKRPSIKLENGNKISTIDLANRTREELIARLSKYSSIHKLKEKTSGKSTEVPEDHSEH